MGGIDVVAIIYIETYIERLLLKDRINKVIDSKWTVNKTEEGRTTGFD